MSNSTASICPVSSVVSPFDSQSSLQNSMLISELENENELSISETDSEFANYTTLRRGIDVGTYGGMRHGKRSFRGSFMSDQSTISSSQSMVVESSESENLFVLNMYATINIVTARFVTKLAEMSTRKKIPSQEEILKEAGFSAEDEPIFKYWIHCFFNKQKCRPVLLNNKSCTGLTVIPIFRTI